MTTKPRRSALPLSRYVTRRPLRSGWGFFFNLPGWARKAGCPLQAEALGIDYAEAVSRAETILLPAFDAWTGNAKQDDAVAVAAPGTLDWLIAEYKRDRRYASVAPKTRRRHEYGFRLVAGHVLKDGRRLGTMRLSLLVPAIIDDVFDRLLVVHTTDAAGNEVERERRTTLNDSMKALRRAWNVCARRHPGKVPAINPFAQMGLKSSSRETPTATYAELLTFRTKAVEMGYASLATAALIGWEWLQRGEDIFDTFDVAHYRPKDRPNAVRVVHEKTREENWIPLFDDTGTPLYPELMAELDAIRRERIGGPMIRRDWGDHAPWPTYPAKDECDLGYLRRHVREIIKAAGLRSELSFTSFRHGGFTESGDAELTDREIMAQGRHKSTKVLPKYVKRTMRQVAVGAKKRREARTPIAE